jgi:hypothetical protein
MGFSVNYCGTKFIHVNTRGMISDFADNVILISTKFQRSFFFLFGLIPNELTAFTGWEQKYRNISMVACFIMFGYV